MLCLKDDITTAVPSDDVDVLIDRFVDPSLTDEVHVEAFTALSELIANGCDSGKVLQLRMRAIYGRHSTIMLRTLSVCDLIRSYNIFRHRITRYC